MQLACRISKDGGEGKCEDFGTDRPLKLQGQKSLIRTAAGDTLKV